METTTTGSIAEFVLPLSITYVALAGASLATALPSRTLNQHVLPPIVVRAVTPATTFEPAA